MKLLSAAIIIAVMLLSCNNNKKKPADEKATAPSRPPTPAINYGLIKTYPHDTNSYTEGLLVHEGKLYESTGYDERFPQTRSLFGEVDLTTGKIAVKAELDKQQYFGEGIVFFNNKVYQLTYRTKVGFIYDARTFKKTGEFTFPSKEGWGMTTDSTHLIMSDGTSLLTWLNPATQQVVKTVQVTDERGPVLKVNELEFINGFIYANIYTTNTIIKIDPDTGNVVGKLDLISLVAEQLNKYPNAGEMNGIAYDAMQDKIYVTGKMWMNIYEIGFGH